MPTPNLILLGYGVTDSLQLTVEAQRVLARYGAAYTIGLPKNLAAFLKSQRVKTTDLAPRLAGGRETADSYLDVASFLIERTAVERPVILLAPGNPMIFNAIGRYLALEGKRLGLSVQSVPAVSQLDLIIGSIGLDVSTFGLQVFDAARLVTRRMQVNPLTPAIVMHLSGLGGDGAPDLAAVSRYLIGCYPPDHPATVVNLGFDGVALASIALARLPTVADRLTPGSHLFLDLVRPTPTSGPPA